VDKIQLRQHRWFDNEEAKALFDQRVEMGWPQHNRPFSTFIAAIGNHWHPGCYDAVKAMGDCAFEQGYDVALAEMPDRCYQPYDGLGLMRNQAYMEALRNGYEFLLMVDNDVIPPRDTLVRLLRRFMPIISPIVVYADGEAHGLTMPTMERGRGLAMVSSHVLSFTLFQTAVFLPWATTPFWESPLGADEDYHFRRLAMAGHRPFVDTDLAVTCLTPPHYPLDDSVGRTVADLARFGQPQQRRMPPQKGGLWTP